MVGDDKEAEEKDKYNGGKQDIGTFTRKLEIYVLGKKVQEKFVNGEDIVIKEDSDIDKLKQLFNKELIQHQHRTVAGQSRMAEIPVFQVWLEEAKQTLYRWFVFNTKDEALAEVVKNGWKNVHLIMGDIKRIHGQEQGYVIPEVEMALTNAHFWFVHNQDYAKAVFDPKHCHHTLKHETNMIHYFRSIEALRNILSRSYVHQDKLDEYDVIKWDKIVTAILLQLPERYTHFVMIMKMQRGLMASMHEHMVKAITAQSNNIAKAVLTAVRSRAVNNGDDAGAEGGQEEEEDIVLPALVIPELGEQAGNFGNRNGNSNPSYKILKETLINIQKEQDHKLENGSGSSGRRSAKVIPMLNTQFGGKGGQGQDRKLKCFDCGKKGVVKRHPGCACPGANNFGPDSSKNGGKGNGKGNGKSNGKGNGKGNQKRKWESTNNSIGSSDKPCFFHFKNGSHASSTSRMEHARRDISATSPIKMQMSRLLPFARDPSRTH